MAEKVPSASDVLEIVEEKLNCSVCLENFTQPKSLPCLHVFCKDCLDVLPHLRHGEGYAVKCPICRRPAPVPKDGVSGFPDQFHCKDYADMQQMLKTMVENQQVTCGSCKKNQGQGFCQQCEHFVCERCINAHQEMEGSFTGHVVMSISDVLVAASQLKPIKQPSTLQCPKHESPLTVYCHSPCDKLICHDCTVRDHKDHECDPISDKNVFKKYKEELVDNLLSTKQRLAFIRLKKEAFNKQKAAITENRDRVKKEIRDTGNELKAEIDKSVNQLVRRADVGAEEKLRFMSAQLEDIQTTEAILQSCVEYVEKELSTDLEQQVLASKTQMVETMKMMRSQIKEEDYSLTEQANIRFVESAGKRTDVGVVEISTLISKFKLSREGTPAIHIGQRSVFNLTMAPTSGGAPLTLPASLISCQFSSPGAACPTDCSIVETAPGKYEVSYTPVSSGLHQLRMRVGDVDIPGSPFTVRVKEIRTIGGLNRPWGVAIGKNGLVVVTEYQGHCVTVIDKKGEKIKSFGSDGSKNEQLKHPTGIAITEDSEIIVSDQSNSRIQKFSIGGEFLAGIGEKGSGKLEFRTLTGLTVDGANKIMVSEFGNRRVQVMSSDFIFSHVFGAQGSQPGQFKSPYCIATDSAGMVYVTDRDSGQILKFTPEGVFSGQFGREGELNCPRGIAIDTTTNTVYVSSNHKVSLFTANGEFLQDIGREGSGNAELNLPIGLAFDIRTGDLYVCDYSNNRLVVY